MAYIEINYIDQGERLLALTWPRLHLSVGVVGGSLDNPMRRRALVFRATLSLECMSGTFSMCE